MKRKYTDYRNRYRHSSSTSTNHRNARWAHEVKREEAFKGLSALAWVFVGAVFIAAAIVVFTK